MSETGRAPRRIALAALSVIALSLAACGQTGAGSEPPGATVGPGITAGPGVTAGPGGATAQPQGSGPGSGTSVVACDLLTDAEIDDITGYTVESKEGGRADVGYVNNCVWLFEGNAYTLVLGIQVSGGARAYDVSFEYESGTPVDGLADKAFLGEDSDSLFALSGDTLINLQLVAVGEADGVEGRLVERVVVHLNG